MISPKHFFDTLTKNGFHDYVGVPDSLLKNFCSYITDHASSHIISTNEGSALAYASGQYLKNNYPSVVYLQNSGFGNLINPLLSLNDEKVYSIPALLIIGWRGEPGVSDEPQHIKQGEIMIQLLNSLNLDYCVMDSNSSATDIVQMAANYLKDKKKPFAILVKKNTFSSYVCKSQVSFIKNFDSLPLREEILDALIKNIDNKSLFITTTGYCSREIYELRETLNQSHSRDFMTVGSMGHVLSIAHGICSKEKNKKVFCIDGDGSLLMHMGALSLNHILKPKNLFHILINNGSHDSVGGQDTNAFSVDFARLSKALGYKQYFSSISIQDINDQAPDIICAEGPIFWEILSKKGSRENLGRPKSTPKENLKEFIDNINV